MKLVFIYDGNLVKKIKPDNSKTIYPSTGLRAGVGGLYEVDKDSGGTITKTTVYYPGGAMRINSTLYYTLKDHLGSASVVTDSTGAVVGEQRYYPFGETRLATGSMFTDKLYTSQREMAGLGIYHYGARFYSPKLGRFLSADSMVPNAGNPQDFNRYSYVRNNPVRYVDPTGHVCSDPDAPTRTCESGRSYPNNALPLRDSIVYLPYDPGSQDLQPRRPRGNGGAVTEPQPIVTVDPPVVVDVPGQCDYSKCTDEREYIDFRDDVFPDYVTLNLAIPSPLRFAGLDLQLTLDYYGRWYVAGGAYVGTPGISIFGGYIIQDTRSEQDLEEFITTNSIFVGGGYGLGGDVTWGRPFEGELNWNDFAGEWGLTTPGGAAGWTYGVPVSNVSNLINSLIGNP